MRLQQDAGGVKAQRASTDLPPPPSPLTPCRLSAKRIADASVNVGEKANRAKKATAEELVKQAKENADLREEVKVRSSRT